MMYAAASACFLKTLPSCMLCIHRKKEGGGGRLARFGFEVGGGAIGYAERFSFWNRRRIFVRPCCVSPLWRTNG